MGEERRGVGVIHAIQERKGVRREPERKTYACISEQTPDDIYREQRGNGTLNSFKTPGKGGSCMERKTNSEI